MAWNSPATPITATPITVAFWNVNARDNLNYLRGFIPDAPGANYGLISTGVAGASFQKIPTAAIADLAITNPKYALGSIGTGQIANAQITTVLIADANVTTPKIADANVTAAKLAAGAAAANVGAGGVSAAMLAAGAALSNLGYTPVNRAGDLGITGALGWSPTTFITATAPNQLFFVSGQNIYLVDAGTGLPVGTFDVVNKTFLMAGGAFSIGSLTLSAALAGVSGVLTGSFQAATLIATGAVQAASAAISGNETVGGTLGVTGVATFSTDATVGGTFGVTGAQTNLSSITATRLISTVATGTPPLNVTSTTVVPNLRAATANAAASVDAGVVTDVGIAAANKDGAAGTASMRTLGTGAQQAAAGNHAHSGAAKILAGTYTGNGAAQTITVGFAPTAVFVMNTTLGTSGSVLIAGVGVVPIQGSATSSTSATFTGTGFAYGGSGVLNSSGQSYAYVAIG